MSNVMSPLVGICQNLGGQSPLTHGSYGPVATYCVAQTLSATYSLFQIFTEILGNQHLRLLLPLISTISALICAK